MSKTRLRARFFAKTLAYFKKKIRIFAGVM